jgi:hypothetical protein
MKANLAVETIVIEDEMQYDGVTVLSYRIEYPRFSSAVYKKSVIVLNNFYQTRALDYMEYCRTTLYRMAVEQYLDDVKNGYPVKVFGAQDVFTITYNESCILSLYFDRYEYTGGAHGSTIRSSQTWNLESRKMIRLGELFDCLFNYKEYIIRNVIEQIEQNPDIYFEDYENLVRDTFNPDSFYCTPQGLTVYFQQYDIAPYASGIREFLLPYNDCPKNPVRICSNSGTSFSFSFPFIKGNKSR